MVARPQGRSEGPGLRRSVRPSPSTLALLVVCLVPTACQQRERPPLPPALDGRDAAGAQTDAVVPRDGASDAGPETRDLLRPDGPDDGGAAEVPDLSVGPDLSPAPDVAPGPDLSPAPDLAPAPDLSPAPDVAPAQDVAPASDLSVATDAGPAADLGDAGARPSDPGLPGPAPARTLRHELMLDEGLFGSGLFGTSLVLTIRVPDGAGPFPVVVLLHGFLLDPGLYASYGEHLASWGYLVVLPRLPGRLVGGPTHRELAEHVRFLLDWLVQQAATPDGLLGGMVDPARLALGGHSLGGKIALLTASQDPRPQVVFGLDPVDSGSPLSGSAEDYPSVTPERMGRIVVPLLLLGETTNGTCEGLFCQACAPTDENFHQYFVHASSPALEVELLGANHMSFLDDPDCGVACAVCPAGTDDPAQTLLLTRRTLTAFLDVFLRDEPARREFLTGPTMAAQEAAGLVRTARRNGL